MQMHRTLVWWSLWGLVVGIGLFGLQEAHYHSIHFIIAFPLLTGAGAAAVMRLKHEYHEAMLHAKWVLISSVLLLLGSGYVYLKAEAYGPFSTASTTRAFLGTRFEMSPPEVERTLGRRLETTEADRSGQDGFKDWIVDVLPDFEHKTESRVLPELVVYHVPGKARFDFVGGKLAKVTLEFQPTAASETPALQERIQTDLSQEYQRGDVSPRAIVYKKPQVDATLVLAPIDPQHQQLSVVLQYLPLADQTPGPLTVDTKAF